MFNGCEIKNRAANPQPLYASQTPFCLKDILLFSRPNQIPSKGKYGASNWIDTISALPGSILWASAAVLALASSVQTLCHLQQTLRAPIIFKKLDFSTSDGTGDSELSP